MAVHPVAVSFAQFLHDLLHPITGPTSAQHGGYLFYSGIAGVSFIGGGIWANLIHRIRHRNCHARWCWRIGRYPVAGGKYTVCCKHHEYVPDRSATAQQIAHEHREWLGWIHHSWAGRDAVHLQAEHERGSQPMHPDARQ